MGAEGWPGVSNLNNPTAIHMVADAHDTLKRAGELDRVGFGVGCTFQFVPFHLSTKDPEGDDPTAVHAAADAHDTALISVLGALGMD